MFAMLNQYCVNYQCTATNVYNVEPVLCELSMYCNYCVQCWISVVWTNVLQLMCTMLN